MAKSSFTAAVYTAAHAENDAMFQGTAAINTIHDMDGVFEALAVDPAHDPQIETDVLTADEVEVLKALETPEGVEGLIDLLNTEDVVLDSQTTQTFDEILDAISADDALLMAVEVGKAIDERMDFEKAKGNDNIQKALAKSRKQLANSTAARVLIVCSVDPQMINRSVHEGVRYNVYALGKLADAIHGLNSGSVNNAINVACMKSLFRFNAAGKDFTGEMAKAAASDKIKVDTGLRGMLVRHTVSASTASTQASSTMQALTTLGIVSRSGSHKNPTFNLTHTAVVAKLQSVLGEAIAA